MRNSLTNLIEELIQEGADKYEAEELALIAKNLSNGINLQRAPRVKQELLNKIILSGKDKNPQFVYRNPMIATFIAIILFISFSTIVSAQSSLPGQVLYPLKRASEKMVGVINPGFKDQILIRRSKEINKLSTQDNKNSKVLINTINDYENELKGGRTYDIKVIEESKINLEEASRRATDSSKIEIDHILKQTDDRNSDSSTNNKSGSEYSIERNSTEYKKPVDQDSNHN